MTTGLPEHPVFLLSRAKQCPSALSALNPYLQKVRHMGHSRALRNTGTQRDHEAHGDTGTYFSPKACGATAP